MAETSAKHVAEWLALLLRDRASLLTAVEDDLRHLRDQLVWMDNFLQDPRYSDYDSYVFRLYISQVEELAKEARDVVQWYCNEVLMENDSSSRPLQLIRSIQARGNVKPKFDALSQKMSALQSNFKIFRVDLILDGATTAGRQYLNEGTQAEEAVVGGQKARKTVPRGALEKLVEEIEDQQQQQEFPQLEDDLLEKLVEKIEKQQQQQEFPELEDDYPIVGRKEDVNKLFNTLAENRVVGVCGIRGIGKTALARLMLRDPETQNRFPKHCWVHADGDVDFCHFLQKLYCSVVDMDSERDIGKYTEQELVSELRSILMAKPCLVVLDDVRHAKLLVIALLDLFENTHPHSSRLLFTTRDSELATLPGVAEYYLQNLDEESSWSLLRGMQERDLGAEGDEIVRRMLPECKGNPLALVTLGMTCAKKALKEWEATLEMTLMTIYPERRLEHALGAAYHLLPDFVKPCILHLCSFPEEYQIPVALVFRMWIAAGFLSSSNRASTTEESSEDIILNKLVELSLVQVHHTSGGPTKRIESITMDVHARRYFLSKANKKDFLVVSEPREYQSNSSKMVAIYFNKDLSFLDLTSEQKFPQRLRSLFTCPVNKFMDVKRGMEDKCQRWIEDVCEKFTRLQILHLQRLPIGGSLQRQIKNLVFLKYLSLKGTNITDVPPSIGDLMSLQTLDLRVRFTGKVIKVPSTLSKAKQLIHLFLPAGNYVILGEGKVLRLDTLSHLETLKNGDISRCMISDLLMVKKIKRLTLKLRTNDGLNVLLSLITFAKNVQRLSILADGAAIVRSGKLLENALLYRLDVEGIISGKLSEVVFPTHLEVLKLESSNLKDDPMSVLMCLPKLRSLALGKDSFLGDVMVCKPSGFVQLKKLKLASLPNFSSWIIEEGALPNLEQVVIEKCHRFRIPPCLPSSAQIIGDVLSEEDETAEHEMDNSSNYTGKASCFQCLRMY